MVSRTMFYNKRNEISLMFRKVFGTLHWENSEENFENWAFKTNAIRFIRKIISFQFFYDNNVFLWSKYVKKIFGRPCVQIESAELFFYSEFFINKSSLWVKVLDAETPQSSELLVFKVNIRNQTIRTEQVMNKWKHIST